MGDAEALKNVIQDCLHSESHPCEVRHIGTGRDGDLFLIDDESAWLVLIKRRWFDWAGPVEAIEFLNGVMDSEGECSEMMITGASPYTRLAHRVHDMPNEHVKPVLKAMISDVFNSQTHPNLALIEEIPTTEIKSWGRYFSLGLRLPRRAYRVHVQERSHLSKILNNMPEARMHPWLRALQDVHVYDHALNLPDEFGSLFEQSSV